MTAVSVILVVGTILLVIWVFMRTFTRKRERGLIGIEVPKEFRTETGVLLYFRSRSCRVCKKQDKVIEEIRKEVMVREIDVNLHSGLVRSIGIFATPTFLVVKDGRVIKAKIGLQNLDVLRGMIEEIHGFSKTGG